MVRDLHLLFQEQTKFLSANYDQLRIKNNCSSIEASRPTSDFAYLTRPLVHGTSFCVSVTKVLSKQHTDFSFIIGFTSCSPSLLNINKKQHFTVQCCPAGCGGHSQQLKIFNTNKIGAKVTVERHRDGEIYFAIDSNAPIRIQFDRNSCSINLVRQESVTPYIQLSGNVLALEIATNNTRNLNIRTSMQLGTATAYGPPIHKQANPINCETHQAFVAPFNVGTKFILLKYPESDVKVSVNRSAVLRKNERGERFVFYVDKILNLNASVTVQVSKIYDGDKYSNDFEFGVMTVSSNYMEMFKNDFLLDSLSVQNASHCFKIHHKSVVNDQYQFTRTGTFTIEIKKNDTVYKMLKIDRKFAQAKNLLPFVILNGSVSGLYIVNNETSLKFGETYEWPAMDVKATENVKLTNETLLTWSPNNVDGVVVNAKPFDHMLRFIIRELRTSINGSSLSFGVINSTKIGFKTPREMSTCLDFKHDNLIPLPALGLKFSLYKSPYGKVTLKCDNGQLSPTTLFTVDPSNCYYPVLIFNGSVGAIELLPNPSKTIVKEVVDVVSSSSYPKPLLAAADECKICMDHTINSVFVPCGHRFACHDCGKDWMQNVNKCCPVCRNKIDILLKTFD